jgi:hypothetical protein
VIEPAVSSSPLVHGLLPGCVPPLDHSNERRDGRWPS